VPKIFFAYGFGNSVTFPFAAGRGRAAAAGPAQAGGDFSRPSGVFVPPSSLDCRTLYTSLTKARARRRRIFSSLRMALSAAEVLSADVFNGWKALTGLEIIEGLGSTEVLHIYLSNQPERKKLGARRPAGARL